MKLSDYDWIYDLSVQNMLVSEQMFMTLGGNAYNV